MIFQHVPVEKIIRAKYQDNLEMMQWLKAFFDSNFSGATEYNAAARRAGSKGGKVVKRRTGPAEDRSGAAPRAAARTRGVTKEKENVTSKFSRIYVYAILS